MRWGKGLLLLFTLYSSLLFKCLYTDYIMFIMFKREETYLPVTPTHLTHTAFQLKRSSGYLKKRKKKMMDAILAEFLCRSKTPCIFSIQHSINVQQSQVLCVGKCVFVCVDPAGVTAALPFGNYLTPTCILRKVKRERQE